MARVLDAAQGHRVMLSDLDTVWLSDPRRFLLDADEAPAGADLAVSTDCLSAKRDAEATEGVTTRDAGCVQGQLNTGAAPTPPFAVQRASHPHTDVVPTCHASGVTGSNWVCRQVSWQAEAEPTRCGFWLGRLSVRASVR
jgi:hypothetical protein